MPANEDQHFILIENDAVVSRTNNSSQMVGDKDTRAKDGDEQDKEYDEHKDTRGYNTASNSQRQLRAKYARN